MADQKRWFKLWASAPSDDDLQSLSPAHRWAWVVFGVYTKVHGTRGRVSVSRSNLSLASEMGLSPDVTLEVIKSFPHITVEESQNPSHSIIVTWHNWHKYQEDTTMAERQSASRSKRRGEEKRSRREKKPPPTSPPVTFQIPNRIQEALKRSPLLGQTPRLQTPAFWQAQVRANSGVNFGEEILKAEAWLAANPGRAPRKDLSRFLHNWLSRAERPPDTEE